LRFPKEFVAFFAGAAGHLTAVIFEVFSVPPNRPKVNDFHALDLLKKWSA